MGGYALALAVWILGPGVHLGRAGGTKSFRVHFGWLIPKLDVSVAEVVHGEILRLLRNSGAVNVHKNILCVARGP